jgi:hypothetical protein
MSKPVTKGQLDEALTDLRAEMAQQNRELLERLTELIRDAQAEILKAFFPFQEAVNVRFRKLEADNSNLNAGLSERMGIVEGRLTEIERKLLMNPPPS